MCAVSHVAQNVLYGCDAVRTVVVRHADSAANTCYHNLSCFPAQRYALKGAQPIRFAQRSADSHRAVRESPPPAPSPYSDFKTKDSSCVVYLVGRAGMAAACVR
jgi:hypothetical protein